MEHSFQRWSWASTALSTIFGAFLLARTVSTLLATALLPQHASDAITMARPGSPPPTFELDPRRLARTFGVPVPSSAPSGPTVEVPDQPGWDESPVRSPLPGVLISTALANPERYSLSQIVNTSTNETAVYVVNDRFLGAQI